MSKKTLKSFLKLVYRYVNSDKHKNRTYLNTNINTYNIARKTQKDHIGYLTPEKNNQNYSTSIVDSAND